jgi:hypothetical protein
MRRVYFLISLGLSLLILTVGCNTVGETSGTTFNTIEITVPPQKTIPPSPPYTIEVAFPDGAPSLNEEAVLTCKVNSIFQLTNLNIELKLPEFLELVNGGLTFSGDIKAGDGLIVIIANIKATGIGNGTIQIHQSMVPETQGFSFNPDWIDAIYVSIFKESARWEKFPIWSEGSGPGVAVHISGDPLVHINTYMSFSQLPRLHETMELLCTIMPGQDYPNIKAEIVLPEGVTLIDGNLEWQGDLEADTPVHFLAKIEFTQTGDYCINAGLWRWFNGEYSWKVTSSKCLRIGLNKSEYWHPTISPDENLPPPPTTWIEPLN